MFCESVVDSDNRRAFCDNTRYLTAQRGNRLKAIPVSGDGGVASHQFTHAEIKGLPETADGTIDHALLENT